MIANLTSLALVSTSLLSIYEPQWSTSLSDVSMEWRLIVPSNNSLSAVSYTYGLQNPSLVAASPVDEANELIAAPPGMHVWGPHPEKIVSGIKLSLEEVFRRSIEALGWNTSINGFLWSSNPMGWIIRPFEQDLTEWTPKFTPMQSIDQFESSLMESVRRSRDRIFPGLVWLEKFDVIEPYASEVSHTETTFDAFTVFPLKVYREYQTVFFDALQSYADGPPRFPLEWLIAEKENFPRDVRMAVLALLTHNHICERSLIQGIALQEGLVSAYTWANLISKAYLVEQDFWKSISEAHLLDDAADIFPLGVKFLESRSKWLINISPKVRIFGPLYGFQSATNAKTLESVPYFQRYHYYGAFVAAARLRAKLNFDNLLLKKTVQSLGIAYKIKTKGLDRAQIKKMNLYYRLGAEHFLNLESYL